VIQTAQPTSPRAEFRVEGAPTYDRRGPKRWVLSHLGRHPALLAGFAFGLVGASLLNSTVARLTGVAFDEVVGGLDVARLTSLALIVLAAVLVRGVLDLGASFAVETLAQRIERDAREELYLSLLGKSQTFHERQRVGDVMARATNDVRQLNGMMNPGVSLIGESLLGLVVPIVFVAVLDPQLLAAPLAFVVAFAFALRRYTFELNPVTAGQRRAFGELNAGLNETIEGIEVVKSTAQEPAERARFSENARRFRDQFVRQGLVQARYLPLLIVSVAFAAAFAHGLLRVADGAITSGELVAYMGLVGLLRFPAFISIFTFSLVELGLAGARRMLELIRTDTELDENPTGHTARVQGAIEFQDVTFAYGGEAGREGLQGVSFRVEPGQTVAIVGTTGSGKSTLTKLVNRVYDATAGRVLVDGVDVRDWSLASLRSQMSVIEQDVFLFARSVEENVAFGLEGATREAVVEAARAAQALEFVERLPEGFATVIGERGTTLSGGQRQRLAIARALLVDPRVLVLDDATSAVDSATEDAIQRAIHAVLQGRTTLLITHRLAQIRRADLVILLERGRVVDQGTHTDLLARSAAYRRIFGRN
jgi:ATP-binding cassette, subfamily B, bacterial